MTEQELGDITKEFKNTINKNTLKKLKSIEWLQLKTDEEWLEIRYIESLTLEERDEIKAAAKAALIKVNYENELYIDIGR